MVKISDSIGPTLIGKQIVLGVTGSIAAYKAVALLRTLIREGAIGHVVMTQSATKFVTPLTFEVLSGHPVSTDLFEAHQEMKHLSLPEQADAIVIAPATANCLAKAALGLGDDLLSTMLLTAQCPLIVAPAMDGGMWTHPYCHRTCSDVAREGRRSSWIRKKARLLPDAIGQGRLAEEDTILEALQAALAPQRDWQGHRVLVSAGPTQEPIDPVRYHFQPLVRQDGLCHCRSRAGDGEPRWSSSPVRQPYRSPRGVEVVSVETAEEMTKARQHTVELVHGRHHGRRCGGFSPEASRIAKNKKQDKTTGHLISNGPLTSWPACPPDGPRNSWSALPRKPDDLLPMRKTS